MSICCEYFCEVAGSWAEHWRGANERHRSLAYKCLVVAGGGAVDDMDSCLQKRLEFSCLLVTSDVQLLRVGESGVDSELSNPSSTCADTHCSVTW